MSRGIIFAAYCGRETMCKFCESRMFMLTVSEVAKTGKGIFRSAAGWILLGVLFLFSAPSRSAEPAHDHSNEAAAEKASQASVERLGAELGDCNWQVTYRGRQYDLSPLTREALSRPIENDIRFAIQRVPEANARLENMTSLLRNARAHTIIASVFLSALLVTKLLQSRVTNEAERENYNAAAYGSGGFFLAATFFSWKSTREAKQELVRAVDEFNAHSPHKILPASQQGIELR
jgi:hypothetical protein